MMSWMISCTDGPDGGPGGGAGGAAGTPFALALALLTISFIDIGWSSEDGLGVLAGGGAGKGVRTLGFADKNRGECGGMAMEGEGEVNKPLGFGVITEGDADVKRAIALGVDR